MGFLSLLILIALIIAVIVLFARLGSLKQRMARLELSHAELGNALKAGRLGAMSDAADGINSGAADVVANEERAETPTGPVAEPARGADQNISEPWPELTSDETAAIQGEIASASSSSLPSRISALGNWLKLNWVYAVSAISLALAGIFFVQYGIEKGLLPPVVRVLSAILFGLALIGVGEWVRRRWGDRDVDATAYLPSTFSGAGLVSIFAGIVSARQLYGLIGAEAAFAGLGATTILAIILGWFYGPFLAAIGLVGATAAPFVVGGESDAPYWLYGYFVLIVIVGLIVDTIRRWAWVSVLSVVLGIVGGALVFASEGGPGWFALMLAAVVVLTVCVPARGFIPDHAGAMNTDVLRLGRSAVVAFPTKLAAGVTVVVSALLLVVPTETGAESALVYLCLAGLTIAYALWSGTARALSDLTVLPAAAFLVRLGFEGASNGPLARAFADQSVTLRAPETSAPWTMTVLLGLAAAMSVAAALTSEGAGRLKPFWAAGAVLIAPLAALALELFWNPSDVNGRFGWSLHVIALAILMVGFAMMFARADAADKRRVAYATLSTLSLVALALFLLTTKGALTLALAVLVVTAAWLDRRFRLTEMGLFILAGVVVLSWRLVIDPGLDWAIDAASLPEVVASYGGSAAAMAAGLYLLAGLNRRAASVILESAGAAYAALFVNVLIIRWLISMNTGDMMSSHFGLTLEALPWLILMLTQLYRLKLGGMLKWVRWVLAALAGMIGFGLLLAAVLWANPLFGNIGGTGKLVHGPLVVDTLLVAYALPGLLFLFAKTRLDHVHRILRSGFVAIGAASLALYAGLEIRRFWRGDDLSVFGVTQPELYSYTIALMLLGAALLYRAIARRSQGLRRFAMAIIALTIAKVFLIDISGLTGLTRVFSFLALGLSLAGLAFLNRWAAMRQSERNDGSVGQD